MRLRVSILSICAVAALTGCEKDPNAEENQPPAPTPTPRRAVRVLPTPHVTPWAPISKTKPAGPDTTWLYNVPATPTPTPFQLKPFHSALDGSSLNGSQPGSNPRPGATPAPFHSSLDDPLPRSGGAGGSSGSKPRGR